MNNSAYTAALVVDLLIAAAAYVWMGLALSALFRKAGQAGWKAWVPFLNAFALLELGGLSGWFILLALVPLLGWVALFVVFVMAFLRINRAFGYGAGMTVLAALLTLVWMSVLGWGSARWLGGPGRGSLRTSNAGLDSRSGSTDAPPARSTPSASAPSPSSPASAFTPSPAVPAPAPPAPPARAVGFASSAAAAPAGMSPAPARRAGAAPESSAATDATGDDEATEVPPPFSQPAGAFASPRRSTGITGVAPVHLDEDSDDAQIVGTTSSGSPAPGPRRTPISSVPAGPAAASPRDPWARPAEPDTGDSTGEISAVAGAPALGGPLSARSSVSAQRSAPEVPDDASADETIVAPRRRPRWVLTPPLGAAITLTSDVVIVGRRPAEDPRYPSAQLVPIADETRTMSKTHARLERREDAWLITDLSSTNGIALIAADGEEIEVPGDASATVVERFMLGDAELRLARDGA